uniref:CCAAT/enhancer-binding protein zeta n=1 Tax=Esox lucius TaxID=8010 RepID=A0A6Q2WZS6_ESOLU
MAPIRKNRKKVVKTNVDNVKNVFENDNDGDEREEINEDINEDDSQSDGEFNLDEVLRLGGTRADYTLLVNITDENDLVDGGKKGAIDDLEPEELETFITKLGIRSYKDQQIVPDEPTEEEKAETSQKGSKNADAKKTKLVEQKPIEAKGKELPDKTPVETKNKGNKETGKKVKINANTFEFQQRQLLLIKPGGKWFDLEYTTETTSDPQDESLVSQYKALAIRLFEAETGLYKTKKNMQKGANSAWMKNVVSAGTLIDRMAAMTVLIQDSPVHSIEHIENLVTMVKKRGSRRQGLMALDTLRELFMSDLLPDDRKLRTFAQHPFDKLETMASGNKDARDRRLILWHFEHLLKHHVADFVVALDVLAHDTVAATKAKALATAHELLMEKPEQERAVLIQVANKLGDPEYKTAAKASYLLETVLHKHPNMKMVVCSEVERLMFRPNVSLKAQYYAVCFLNQVLLSHDEAELAGKLISIYFSFFRACIKKKDVESKMLGALLSGVNRAYPYAETGDEKVKEQLDTLFKVVHLAKFNTAVQALMLLFQVMDSQQIVSDRFYVSLYRKLIDPGLSQCSRQSMFLNLIYKSLKADIVLRRVKAFVKRLLQVSCEQNSTFACGALFLVSEVMKSRPGLKLLLQEDGDCEEEKFKDLKEEEDDDDEEERFVDADKEEEEPSEKRPEELKPMASSWVHHQNLEGGKSVEGKYDPLHRNPLFCGADHTTLWELHRLAAHFHPSVSLFAKTILRGEFISYTGDPLQDFTLGRFLDRFVFRNPKQLKGKQHTDAAVMQPKHKQSMGNIHNLPVNSKEFLSNEESQIPVDKIFFYRFFKKQAAEKALQHPQRHGDNESVEDVDDDEFEKLLDAYEGDSYFTDLGVDETDLDFAGNVKAKPKKGNKGGEDESDSDLDDELDGDLDDEEVSLGSMGEEDSGDELEEEGGAFMDSFGEDDEDEMEVPDITPFSKCKSKRKASEDLDFSGSIGSKPGKKRKGKGDTGMFASAEEVGFMLDENVGSKFDNIGMNAMANKDKAGEQSIKSICLVYKVSWHYLTESKKMIQSQII